MNECDTDADTCCLGMNFVVYAYTTRTAEVSSYDRESTKIVPIVTGATAYDDKIKGETIILLFHESLFYGDKLDHSLINPNQIRHYGIPAWDNPFDKERSFGIEVDNETFIPFSTIGTKIYFNTRTPMKEEMETCRKITMTSPEEWVPEEVELKNVDRVKLNQSKRQINAIKKVNGPNESVVWIYDDSESDEVLLHEINPMLTRGVNELQINSYDEKYDDVRPPRFYISTERHTKIVAEDLAEKFCIGLERAKATLRVTRQRGTRSAILPISRRYRADRMFQVKRLEGKFATDTLWSKVLSLEGYKASQVYSHKCGFKAVYHMKRADGESVGNTLSEFVHEYGAPSRLTFDGAAVQKGKNTLFYSNLRRSQIRWHMSSPRRPEENPAEQSILELKGRWYRMKNKLNIPDRLWDFGISYVAETGNVIATGSRYSKGRTPLEIVTGETPDITEYLDFSFYDWVTFRANAGLGDLELGRWLGVSHRVGQMMSYWILPKSAIPISCCTVQRLTELEKKQSSFKERMDDFMEMIKRRMDARSQDISNKCEDIRQQKILDSNDEEFEKEYSRVVDNKEILDQDEISKDQVDEIGVLDPYLGMEVNLPRDNDVIRGRVKMRVVDDEGNAVGVPNNNPLLDTRKYHVEFLDGSVEEYTANNIAENILSQVDEEGHRNMMLDEIIDFRKNGDAVPKDKGTFMTKNRTIRKRKTTKGWELLVKWKDGSENWVKLKDMKDSYPVEVMNFANQKKIHNEPAFAWWIPYTNRKVKAIIQKVKSNKYWERTHKYGIRLPKSIKEAEEIDKENGNHLWRDAIRLEMKNVRVGFEVYEGDVKDLVGYEEIRGHLIFDIKLGENFRRKARYVGEGFRASTPANVTYSSVVRRD